MKTILRSPLNAASRFCLLSLVGLMFSQVQAQVQYTSFSATVLDGHAVLLEWETTQEGSDTAGSIYGFYVQRRDQIDTSFITFPHSFQPGSGRSVTPHYYSWRDTNVAAGLYDYRVTAINYRGNIFYSSIVSVVVLPIPTLTSPPNGATGISLSPTLSWDTIPSAISYRLQVASDSLFTNLLFNDSTITTTSREMGTLEGFTRYFWRVKAKDSSGTSAFSTPWNFTTWGPPTNISANAGNHRITLQWSAAGGSIIMRYRIYQGTSSPASTLIDSVSSSQTSYVNTNLINGITYYYRLTSVDSQFTESSLSNEVSAAPFIAAPTNLSATPGNHQIILNWTASTATDLMQYRIYRSISSPASTLIDSVSSTATTYSSFGLADGTIYYYRVTAVDSLLSYSSFSNEVNTVPVNRAPVAARLRDTTMSNAGKVLTDTITFSSSGSYDPDGQIDSIHWYVNNNIVGRHTTLSYNFGPGTSKVMLIIRDNDGARDTTRATVTRSAFKRYLNGPITAGLSLLGDSVLYAIATGDAVYRLDINGNTLYTLQVGGNVLSASSIAYDTTVYIASSDRNLYAFSRFGAPVWPSLPLGGELSATVTIDSVTNRLYIGVENRNFFAINRASGSVAWSYFTDASIQNSAVITTDRKLIFSTIRGTIYGFDLENLPGSPSPTWTLALNDTITSSPAIDPQGFFYMGTKSGRIAKISMQQGDQAAIIWQTQTGSSIVASPVIDSRGILYVGSLDSKFYAIDTATGSIKWSFQTNGPIRSTAAVSPLGIIYFGNDAGQFFALDSAHSVKWYYQDSAAIQSPVLYHNGTVYIGTEAGRVMAFFDGGSLFTFAKGTSANLPIWGTFQGNNQRTGVQPVQISTGVSNNVYTLPAKYSVFQNYPNPFNPSTTISYQLPTQSHVTLKVFDVLGREVATLVNGEQTAGYKSVTWDAADIPTGMYFYRLQAGKYIETKKLLLLR